MMAAHPTYTQPQSLHAPFSLPTRDYHRNHRQQDYTPDHSQRPRSVRTHLQRAKRRELRSREPSEGRSCAKLHKHPMLSVTHPFLRCTSGRLSCHALYPCTPPEDLTMWCAAQGSLHALLLAEGNLVVHISE